MGERSYNRDATISADGITVYQLYTEDEFEFPAVVLKLVSERPERTEARLELPNLDAGRIGFHPEFEGDSWTIGDDQLTFETELDPESSLTTLYLIEDGNETVATRALDECEIAAVTPLEPAPEQDEGDAVPADSQTADDGTADPLSGADDPLGETVAGDDEPADEIVAEDSEAVDDTVTGEADTETAEFGTDPDDILVDPDEEMEAEETDEGESFIDPAGETDEGESLIDADELDDSVDFDARSEDEQEATSTADGGTADRDDTTDTQGDDGIETGTDSTQPQEDSDMTASTQDGPDVSSLSTDELVSELRTRLDEGELSEKHRQQLEAAGLGSAERAADDARIDHLQSRMSDIEAFSTSMEAVLDQYGPPAEAFGEFEERLEAMEAEVAELSNEVKTTADWRETVEPRLDSVEQEVDDVTGDVTAMEENVEELESEVSTLQDWRKKVTGALKMFTDE